VPGSLVKWVGKCRGAWPDLCGGSSAGCTGAHRTRQLCRSRIVGSDHTVL